MTDKRRTLSDEELGNLLRLGDPASDGREPSRDQIAAMRRAVLNSVDTRATTRPRFSRSLVTAMATLAVALVALVILLQAGPWGEVLQPETGPATTADPAPVTDTEPTPVESPVTEAIDPVETAPLVAAEEDPAAAATDPSPDAIGISEVPSTTVAEVPSADAVQQAASVGAPESPGAADTGREARTVQFTAPGGTRIIWTLDPEFEFPIAEPDTGARGEM
jgi:hypothetical protein